MASKLWASRLAQAERDKKRRLADRRRAELRRGGKLRRAARTVRDWW